MEPSNRFALMPRSISPQGMRLGRPWSQKVDLDKPIAEAIGTELVSRLVGRPPLAPCHIPSL